VWFVFVAVGLALLIASGLYARRRIATALAELGVGPRWVRAVRWALAWLLFGFPAVLVVAIAGSLLLGRATIPRFDGLVAGWLLAIPFALAALVVAQATPWLLALDLAARLVRRQRFRAYATLAIAGAFAIYTPARILAERGDLRVRSHRLGAGASVFRIAFLSDVHQDAHTDGDRAREVYALVNAGAPDLVLAGGDWINTGPDYIAAAAEAAGTLHGRLGVFSVRGDHEHFAYRDRERSVTEIEAAMRAHGVQMLDNEVRWFEHANKRIAVVFLGYTYIQRADRQTIERLLATIAGADYSIVVTHQLDSALADQLADRVDLIVAGHTHDGQVNPVLGVVHANLARVETPYVDGRYQRGRTTIIVTAGVGYSIVPFRYAAPGSIERIELQL